MSKLSLKELIAHFRADAQDMVEPYLWSDDLVKQLLNDAEAEAATRRKLLHESTLPQVCTIELVPGKSTYALHPTLFEINWLQRQEDGMPPLTLQQTSVDWLDRQFPDWRSNPRNVQAYAVHNDTTLRLACAPTAAGVLRLEGYRLPINPMKCERDTPEIHAAHHAHLVLWALHRAFSQPDSDGFDPNRASLSEQDFTAYFGPRPDADLRRDMRDDTPHTNVVYH